MSAFRDEAPVDPRDAREVVAAVSGLQWMPLLPTSALAPHKQPAQLQPPPTPQPSAAARRMVPITSSPTLVEFGGGTSTAPKRAAVDYAQRSDVKRGRKEGLDASIPMDHLASVDAVRARVSLLTKMGVKIPQSYRSGAGAKGYIFNVRQLLGESTQHDVLQWPEVRACTDECDCKQPKQKKSRAR